MSATASNHERIPHFVRRAFDEGTKVRDVRKPTAASSKKSGRGFIVSTDPESRDNALLCCDAAVLHLIPFELEPPTHATTEFAQISAAESGRSLITH